MQYEWKYPCTGYTDEMSNICYISLVVNMLTYFEWMELRRKSEECFCPFLWCKVRLCFYLIRLTVYSITNLQCVWVEQIRTVMIQQSMQNFYLILIHFRLRPKSNTWHCSVNIDAYDKLHKRHRRIYTNF